MASLNKWIGIGNFGADPEVRYLSDGSTVANVSIATDYNKNIQVCHNEIQDHCFGIWIKQTNQ